MTENKLKPESIAFKLYLLLLRWGGLESMKLDEHGNRTMSQHIAGFALYKADLVADVNESIKQGIDVLDLPQYQSARQRMFQSCPFMTRHYKLNLRYQIDDDRYSDPPMNTPLNA
jgi:hypothetical protein